MAPEVTVVVPTHDREDLLGQTLGCVLRQCDVDLDVVVVDDGSSDGTLESVRGLGEERVRIVSIPRARGVAASRNLGVAQAKGEWVAFLDDDDLWAPNKLRAQLAAMRSANASWAYTGAVSVDPDLRIVAGGPPPTPERVCEELPFRNVVPAGGSNVLACRDLLVKVGPFDEGLRHMADWDLWIRLSRLGRPAAVSSPFVAYRLHAGNASLETEDIVRELDLVERKHAGLRSGAAIDRAYVHRWIAWGHLRRGDRMEAVLGYLRASRSGDPRSLLRAGAALLGPAVVELRMRRRLPRGPWIEQAREWLDPLAGELGARSSNDAGRDR
jgi:glycosyltransferase involved in cell wall biosynthesis